MTIIFLIPTPLTQRDFNRYGVKRLQNRGFEIWFLDFTELLNPEIVLKDIVRPFPYQQTVNIKSSVDFERFFSSVGKYKTFLTTENSFPTQQRRYDAPTYLKEPLEEVGTVPASSFNDIKESWGDRREEFSCQRSGDNLIIDLSGKTITCPFIDKYIREKKIAYAVFCANSIPRTKYPTQGFPLVSKEFWRRAVGVLKRKIFDQVGTAIPQWILAGGKYDQKGFPRIDGRTKIIWAHALDYDLYLDYEQNRKEILVTRPYAVFLDECFPFHPDFSLRGCRSMPFKGPEEYYSELNEFFAVLEAKLKMPVVIAAHPRTPEGTPDMFRGRQVLQGKTIALVAQADCVLCHGSTSINFAILYKKPIIFLMPGKIKRDYYGDLITSFAAQFGKIPLEVDSIQSVNFEKELIVDERLYADYQENYIKRPQTPKKFFWDIVADGIT